VARSKARSSWRTRRWIIAASVVTLVLLDVVLVSLALQSTQSSPTNSSASSKDLVAESPSPSPTSTSSIPPEVAPPATAPTRILHALNDEVAWRVSTGACPGSAALPELTGDGGVSWTGTDAIGTTGLTSVQNISVTDPSIASFIGFDNQTCSPQFVRTFVAGDDFATYNDELDRSWYVTSAGALHAPDGEVPAPCSAVLSLAPRADDAAAAFCSDGSIHVTTDRAATWITVPAIGSVVAVSSADTGFVAGLVGSSDCPGVKAAFLTDEGLVASSGCLVSDVAPGDLAGTVAIASTGNTIWMWAGDVVSRSLDGGQTWSQR
jgi:hypothetical protein